MPALTAGFPVRYSYICIFVEGLSSKLDGQHSLLAETRTHHRAPHGN